jgi:N utilization substance protein A
VSLCFELGRATVVVNEDQLSLAIGKRGQNVRLAARLTGWDVDILTPPEFQAGVQRLDQTLKQIEGISQEHVDKVIALGLIDVRDIEEVGSGPLMEELGLSEELAEQVVDRCTEEAKVVQQEQEAKKAADAAAKAAGRAAFASAGMDGSRGVDGVAFANPLLQQAPLTEEATVAIENDAIGPDGTLSSSPDNLAGALEATEGLAPEITTHKESAFASGSELSPEEQALQINGRRLQGEDDADRKDLADENTEAAALAEGRTDPPLGGRDEPIQP